MSTINTIGTSLGAVAVIAGGVWFLADWKNSSELQISELQRQLVSLQQANSDLTSRLNKSGVLLDETVLRLSELESSKGGRIAAGNAPTPEEVAAVLTRDHLEAIRGPQGERGPKGEQGAMGPQGPAGTAASADGVLPSNTMVKIDFPAGNRTIRVDGFEWAYPTCSRSGSVVKCETLVKNDSGEDIQTYGIYLSSSRDETRAFTDSLTQNALLGLTSKSWEKKYDGYVSFKFPNGIFYPLTWEVADVPSEATGFTRMDIRVSGGTVKYENVPIQ